MNSEREAEEGQITVSKANPNSEVTQSQRDNFDRSVRGATSDFSQQFDAYSYKLFGRYFSKRREKYVELQQLLDECQYGISADLYLARATLSAILVGIIGVVIGLTSVFTLQYFAILQTVELPHIFPHSTIPVDSFVRTYKFELQALFAMGALLVSFSASAFGLSYIWPKLKAGGRRRKINRTIPYATTFMFALSRGGMNFIEILEKLAESEEIYGEISREVRPIIIEIEYFSRDLPQALYIAGKRTPSEKFQGFTEDLIGVIDTGSDLTGFLEDKSEQFLDESEQDQKNFIEFLELLGEVYVTAFVAGPLFLLIITVVMSMLGGTSIVQLYGIVYLLLPIMNVLFFLFIDTISSSEGDIASTLPVVGRARTSEELEVLNEQVEDDARVERMIEAKKKREKSQFVREPLKTTLRNPIYTLLVTGPLALLTIGFVLLTGLVEPTLDAMFEQPIFNTFFLGVLPLLILVIPYSLFYEVNAYYERKLIGRLPDALKQLASNNAVGMTLPEALEAAAENTGGRLGEEFKQVRNDIEWKHDINGALVAFSNRVQSPVLARTVKLITEANQSTGDIAEVLDVAAKDVITRKKLEREQKGAMRMYTAVIIISFLVYLGVIAILDSSFLSALGGLSGEEPTGGADAAQQVTGESGAGGLDVSDLPVERFKMVFFHSTIIQALSSGMLAGVLGAGSAKAGLKFSTILIIIATVTFVVL